MDIIEIETIRHVVVKEIDTNIIEVAVPGAQGVPGPAGAQGPSVSDGDKGDVVVSGSGATWTIDSALLTAFMRTITAAANAATARDLLGVEIGADVQAYSAVLAATTASFLTAHATKLGHITVTQAVDLDAIETRVSELDASVILKGAWDASAGTFPGAGAAQAGWSYIVSVAGTVNGVAFALNDRIIAIADNASTTTFAANWFKADYTDQVLSVAGKTGALTLQVADITDMSANGRSLVSAANYAAMQTLLGIPAVTVNTFTPTLDGTSTAGVGTYGTQLGKYWRTGDVVYFKINLNWSAHTGTGNIIVNGLPITSANDGMPSPVSILASNLTFSGQVLATVPANSTQVQVRTMATGASLGDVAMDTAATLQISGCYAV